MTTRTPTDSTPTKKEYKALQMTTCIMFMMYKGRHALVAEGFWNPNRTLTDRDIAKTGAEMYALLTEKSP